MKDTFDINTIMYKILASSNIGNNGGIYKNDTRPTNSQKEDIVINVIAMTTESCPQSATTNINVYVPDKQKCINGIDTNVEDTSRLHSLSDAVMNALRDAVVEGIKFVAISHLIIDEPSIHQHYVNIRVNWNIQQD